MSTDATTGTDPNAPHPLDSIAGALRHASNSLGSLDDGVGRRNMQKYGFFGRVAYQTSYGLSFGLSYPAFMVARLVPRDNALVYGLTDGAIAAREESHLKGITHSSGGASDASLPNAQPA